MDKSLSGDIVSQSAAKPGLLNRVFNQTFDGKMVASKLYAASGIALAAASMAVATPAYAQASDAATRSGSTPINVAVMAQGAARSDYGQANVTVNARADSSNEFRLVHAAAGTAKSRGAVATSAMLREMRLHSSNPIVVHAYDPFIRDAAGQQKLNLAGLREMAPLLAKSGVKVAMVSFSISDSPDGRQMSQIMKSNGIAVVAPAPENGGRSASDILTVQPWDYAGKAKPFANFAVNDELIPGVGRIAGTGAIYAQVDRSLRGSQAIGFAIQDRFDQATNMVDHKIGNGMLKMVDTVGLVPGIRIKCPQAPVAHNYPAAALQASASVGSGR